jgi:DNA-binding NtrC family response regulator
MCDKLSQIVQRNVPTGWAVTRFSDVFGLGAEIANTSVQEPTMESIGSAYSMSSLSDLTPGTRGVQADTPLAPESLRVRVRHAVRQVESEIIREALEQHRWNRRRAAEALKISYRSLMYKMKTCNLRDTGQAGQAQGN